MYNQFFNLLCEKCLKVNSNMFGACDFSKFNFNYDDVDYFFSVLFSLISEAFFFTFLDRCVITKVNFLDPNNYIDYKNFFDFLLKCLEHCVELNKGSGYSLFSSGEFFHGLKSDSSFYLTRNLIYNQKETSLSRPTQFPLTPIESGVSADYKSEIVNSISH